MAVDITSPLDRSPVQIAQQNAQMGYASEKHQALMTFGVGAVILGIGIFVAKSHRWIWIVGGSLIIWMAGSRLMKAAASYQQLSNSLFPQGITSSFGMTPGAKL